MVSSVTSARDLVPQTPYLESREESVSIDSLEHLMHDLYKIISEEEGHATSNYSFAVKAERAWRELLSKKLEEEQARLSSHISAEGTVSKISDIVAPLCLAGEGIVSLVTEGVGGRGLAAIALGGLLAIDALCDALCDHSAKKYLAKFLQRANGESEKDWLERISTTCALASVALGVSLPGKDAAQLAKTIATGALDCTRAGVQFSTDKQKAIVMELEYSMDLSGRNMRSLSKAVIQLQDSPHDQMKLLMQLHKSNSATIDGIFR